MDQGYIKATSGNLPRVDTIMVAAFFCGNNKFVGAEMRGVKNERAGRESYGDDAVGYVQICRKNPGVCTLKSRITPEHKVRTKCYTVVMEVNETEGEITSVDCQDCAASSGGCKHAIAFLMWVHRRSEEPAPTSITCYWKKSKLSSVGTSLKFVKTNALSTSTQTNNNPRNKDYPGSFLSEVLDKGRKCDGQGPQGTLFKYYQGVTDIENVSLNNLAYWFIEQYGRGRSEEEFFEVCKRYMSPDVCIKVEVLTQEQSNSSLWYKCRFGRITASKVYEAARCKTFDGSLVESLFGAISVNTRQMQRGKDLEPLVVKVVEQMSGETLSKCGLILNGETPVIGASPDAICEKFVVEVKCPSNNKNITNYVLADGKLAPKCYSQIQLQMHMAGKQQGLFCVADVDFEITNKVHTYEVLYDEPYVTQLINDALVFWKKAIFPKLMDKKVGL